MAATSMEAQLRQVVAELRSYQEQVRQVTDQVLAEHAQEMAALARELSPVHTGFNRDHIEAVRTDFQQYKVSADSPYAGFLELGTARTVARPFLFPAYEATRNNLKDKLTEALKNG